MLAPQNSWTLTEIRYGRQYSRALFCNIHQGKDILKSSFELFKWCNTPRRHIALLCVFRHVVLSVYISLKTRRRSPGLVLCDDVWHRSSNAASLIQVKLSWNIEVKQNHQFQYNKQRFLIFFYISLILTASYTQLGGKGTTMCHRLNGNSSLSFFLLLKG